MNIGHFSSGVSSAVAIKLAIDWIDEIVYIHIDDQHEDTLRFVKDCEQWFQKPINIIQSEYKNVSNVVRSFRYLTGTRGARCTGVLKKRVFDETYKEAKGHCWGFDCGEVHRFERIKKLAGKHRAPLIEEGISKKIAHNILMANKIKRPIMYDLGFHNNNCIGCLKARDTPRYWNLIRKHFPTVFQERAQLEREIGHSINKKYYLDELEDKEYPDKTIIPECGLFCDEYMIKEIR